jgi:hypothetical protein
MHFSPSQSYIKKTSVAQANPVYPLESIGNLANVCTTFDLIIECTFGIEMQSQNWNNCHASEWVSTVHTYLCGTSPNLSYNCESQTVPLYSLNKPHRK